jgi:uncharacterized protein YcaQ
VARRLVEGDLRTWGVARLRELGVTFGGPVPAREGALEDLERAGIGVPAEVEGVPGRFLAHAPALDRTFEPRTVLLSPFDGLVADRRRTEELFGFRYRLEIYVPPAKREFGYYVLPILHGDRLIGRIDPLYARSEARLDVRAVYAEPGAPAEAGRDVAVAIADLARWLGAAEVRFGRAVPPVWQTALAGVAGRVGAAS